MALLRLSPYVYEEEEEVTLGRIVANEVKVTRPEFGISDIPNIPPAHFRPSTIT